MNIEYLKEFIVMAEDSNYTEAAEKLYLSQSTLFKHVKALESELGAPLFKKYGRSAVITKYGEILLKYARQIVQLSDECTTKISEVHAINEKQLTIAYEYRVIELIRDFCLANKGYSVLLSKKTKAALNQLVDGDVDVAILLSGLESEEQKAMLERIEMIPLMSDSYVAVMLPDHPLAGKDSIKLLDLQKDRMILPTNQSDPLSLYLKREGIYFPDMINTATGTEAADMVLSGLGVSILHRATIEERYSWNQLRLVEFEPSLDMTLCVARRKEEEPDAAGRLFIDFVQQYFADM